MNVYGLLTFIQTPSQILVIDKMLFPTEEEARKEKSERTLRNSDYSFSLMAYNLGDATMI